MNALHAFSSWGLFCKRAHNIRLEQLSSSGALRMRDGYRAIGWDDVVGEPIYAPFHAIVSVQAKALIDRERHFRINDEGRHHLF